MTRPTSAALVAAWLADEPVDLYEAVDGADGIEKARHLRPDLILLDVEMPGLDGFAACAILKADPALSDVPIVFLSGRVDDGGEASRTGPGRGRLRDQAVRSRPSCGRGSGRRCGPSNYSTCSNKKRRCFRRARSGSGSWPRTART